MHSIQDDQCIESRYSWIVASVSLVITSLSFGAVTVVPILMEPMSIDLGWTRSTLGMAHALAMIAAGVGGLAFGYLTDRASFAPLTMLGGAAIGVGLVSLSEAASPTELYVSYALLVGGLGQGVFFGPITAYVSRWFDHNRTLAMSVVMCGQSAGGLTVPLALRALAETWGWRNAVASYGALCAVVIMGCSLVFLRSPPVSRSDVGTVEVRPEQASSNQRRIFLATISTLAFLNCGSFVVIAHITAFAEEQDLGPMFGATLLAMLLGATFVFRLLSGILIDRIGAGLVLTVCALMLPVGALILGVGAGIFWLMVTGAVIFGLGYGGSFPALTGIIRVTFPPSMAGTWVSAMFLFGFWAAAIGSWLGGYLRDFTGGYLTSFGFAVALTTASTVLAYLFLCGQDICRNRA